MKLMMAVVGVMAAVIGAEAGSETNRVVIGGDEWVF